MQMNALVLMHFYEKHQSEVASWPKELAIMVRQVYSHAGMETPNWLMAAHGLSAKEPGSCADKTEHYFLFGPWVPSGKLADCLIKYIKFHTDENWNELPPGETARYLMNMKKVIKDFKAAEKQAARDGTEVPDHIMRSMLWNVAEDGEEEDGSMAGSEDSEGLEEEEDDSMAGSEDSEDKDLDTKPQARVSASP